MNKTWELIKNFCKEEDGVTAIEYGLIAALVAVVLVVSLRALGVSLTNIFTYIKTQLDGAR